MKKYENFVYTVCLVIVVTITVVMKPLSNLDEVWNFNIARCISNGLVPYKDISMVSTPLLGFIVAIPLKIFGQEMFFSRICAIIFGLICLFLLFKILKNIGIKKEISNLTVILALIVIVNYIAVDYNFFALILVLQIILIEIKAVKLEGWKLFLADVAIGVLAGFTICTKQSIGLIISIISIFNPVFFIRHREQIKECIKVIAKRIIGVCIPILTFVIYLCANGAFYGFFDYSVKGVKTFANALPYSSLLNANNVACSILAVIVPIILVICAIVCIVAKIRKKEKSTLYILTVYSIGMFTIVFPISDNVHFAFAVIPSIILAVYGLKLVFGIITKKEEGHFKRTLTFINVISVLIILVGTLLVEVSSNENLGKISKYDYQKHFKYIEISEGTNKSITTINDYTKSKEKNVYILDVTSACYMIPMDRYNKNYDMLCVGNFGSRGEESIIEQIKNEDALYLILRDEKYLNWQNPSKVRAYVLENMEFVESISIFDVYQNKVLEEDVQK